MKEIAPLTGTMLPITYVRVTAGPPEIVAEAHALSVIETVIILGLVSIWPLAIVAVISKVQLPVVVVVETAIVGAEPPVSGCIRDRTAGKAAPDT